jgi:hypothetical protein
MLYIDSIASVLTRAFETKENIIDVDVYWSFNGDLEKENINNLSFDPVRDRIHDHPHSRRTIFPFRYQGVQNCWCLVSRWWQTYITSAMVP